MLSQTAGCPTFKWLNSILLRIVFVYVWVCMCIHTQWKEYIYINKWFVKIFSYSVDCLFILLMVSFSVKKLSSLIYNPICWFLPLSFMLLISYPQKSLLRPMLRGFFPTFPSEFYGIRSYVYVFHPFQVNFCEWCRIGVQFHCCACVYSVFAAPFVKETTFFLLDDLGSFLSISWLYL